MRSHSINQIRNAIRKAEDARLDPPEVSPNLDICPKCEGTGEIKDLVCSICEGSGKVDAHQIIFGCDCKGDRCVC
jgi:RecJ-like exonuclease